MCSSFPSNVVRTPSSWRSKRLAATANVATRPRTQLAAAVAASAPLPRWPRALPFFRLHLTRLKLLGGPGGAEAAAQFRFSGTLDRREEQVRGTAEALSGVGASWL